MEEARQVMILGLSLLLIIIILIGFYMSWNIGANDLANSMASAVGAKAVSLRVAVILGGIMAFIGAVFVGSNVADTIKSGIVDSGDMSNKYLLFGSLAALLGASFWITIATWKELPISTTHSIVGGMVGFGIVAGGAGVVNWFKIGSIALSWIISPVLGGVIAYFIFRAILKYILQRKNPVSAARNIGPIFIAITVLIVSMSIFLKTPAGSKLGLRQEYLILIPFIISGISLLIGWIIISRYLNQPKFKKIKSESGKLQLVENIFRRLQIMTSCYIAFALGANDVANAIGPMSVAWSVELKGSLGSEVEIPIYLLMLGGIGIVSGMLTWGYKVIKTIGTKITQLTNTRGFSIDFGAATSVLLASKAGMPVSTTHAVVGAVIGVGLARGLGAIDLRVIRKIIITWVITVPIAAVTTAGLFLMFITFV